MIEWIQGFGKPKKKATIFTSDAVLRLEKSESSFKEDKKAEFGMVKVYPGHTHQEIIGFGGAFTEAAATVFDSLSEKNQQLIIEHYFSPEGCNYNLCRTHIQSCDFALGNYEYVSDKHDEKLETFSLGREADHLIPFMQRACARNPELEILASPWSPPAFMKSNATMNRGGRLKEKYYDRWAQIIVRYLQEMHEKGLPITRLTAQNEPMATQTWDSCIYTAAEEAAFVYKHLKPTLVAAGLNGVKVLVWDQNKDRILDRIDEMMASSEQKSTGDQLEGIAFHWYTGDHFEALAEIRRCFPESELIMTEMCLGHGGAQKDEVTNAEYYAHEIIGDFNAGAQGFIDWNLLLDIKGGPNHVGNYCNAPLLADAATDTVHIGLESRYIAHFSRFVQRGARHMVVSRESNAVEAVGFVNPDGSRVAVVLNRRNSSYELRLFEGIQGIKKTLPPHSITTIVWD